MFIHVFLLSRVLLIPIRFVVSKDLLTSSDKIILKDGLHTSCVFFFFFLLSYIPFFFSYPISNQSHNNINTVLFISDVNFRLQPNHA